MNNYRSAYNENNLLKPVLYLPRLPPQVRYFHLPKKVDVKIFYVIADGCKKVFTDYDATPESAVKEITDPNDVSFLNLFINGVLQPYENYTLEKGSLTLNTEDIPIKGAPLILQMITL